VTEQILIIAEAGVNHNGSVEMACDLVDAAADAGADIVKFQTWKTDEALTKHAPKPRYQKRATGTLDSQIEMVRRLELNEEEHRKIVEHCALRSVEFLSSPFDLPSFQFLVDDLRVRRLKIASSEIDNAPLLLAAARSGRPVFLSTGMSTLGDVETALAVLAHGLVGGQESLIPAGIWEAYSSEKGRQKLEQQVTLLHCTTEYPAAVETANLRALNTLGDAFALPVGLSDHTPGIAVSIAAAARGAAVLEKHLTLDRTLSGPDHAVGGGGSGCRTCIGRRQKDTSRDRVGEPPPVPQKSGCASVHSGRGGLQFCQYRDQAFRPWSLSDAVLAASRSICGS
jgi:N-acetylneuraminate synthase